MTRTSENVRGGSRKAGGTGRGAWHGTRAGTSSWTAVKITRTAACTSRHQPSSACRTSTYVTTTAAAQRIEPWPVTAAICSTPGPPVVWAATVCAWCAEDDAAAWAACPPAEKRAWNGSWLSATAPAVRTAPSRRPASSTHTAPAIARLSPSSTGSGAAGSTAKWELAAHSVDTTAAAQPRNRRAGRLS